MVQDTPTVQEQQMSTVTTTEDLVFNSSHRCDRCMAQAYAMVIMSNGFELLFCGHHLREHGDKLKEVAIHIQDETQSLEL